jgi:predicted enzyme related to lactoylglutathione lyase
MTTIGSCSAAVAAPIADMGHSWAAWFVDPSGNVLAVVQPKG